MLEEKKATTPMMQIAVSRKEMYAYFGEIFLQEPKVDLWPQQCQVLTEFLQTSGIEAHFGERVFESTPEFINHLRQEYFDCFFVPMSGKYVPPYESALLTYQANKRKPFSPLNSPEANHVAQCYASVGFKPSELHMFAPLKEIQLPDQAGFELIFMAMLCGSEAFAWGKNDSSKGNEWRNLQFQFLKDHLVKWWPNFAVAIVKRAPGYYAQAIKAAEIWIQSELEFLDDELNKGGISHAGN